MHGAQTNGTQILCLNNYVKIEGVIYLSLIGAQKYVQSSILCVLSQLIRVCIKYLQKRIKIFSPKIVRIFKALSN